MAQLEFDNWYVITLDGIAKGFPEKSAAIDEALACLESDPKGSYAVARVNATYATTIIAMETERSIAA